MIMAGDVLINGRVADKPSSMVNGDEEIMIKSKPPFVSRAGLKLAAALDYFNVQVEGLTALDVGASTGGFTDCLLQRGARRVYAVDVGYGQLAWKLRQDARVVVMEKVNVRYLNSLPEAADIATLDVSFISLKLVIPPVVNLLKAQASIIALVKPQFEAGRHQVGKGGVVRDHNVHQEVLHDFINWSHKEGLAFMGLMVSPLRGPAGNIEFLTLLKRGVSDPGLNVQKTIETCLHLLYDNCSDSERVE